MKGEAGFDRLAGGLGNDYLIGGADVDAFMFTTVANTSTNRDSIADFVHGVDQIWMDNAVLPAAGRRRPAEWQLLPARRGRARCQRLSSSTTSRTARPISTRTATAPAAPSCSPCSTTKPVLTAVRLRGDLAHRGATRPSRTFGLFGFRQETGWLEVGRARTLSMAWIGATMGPFRRQFAFSGRETADFAWHRQQR